MGKATIVSGGTDGKYVIKLDYGKAVRDTRVTEIDKRLVVLAGEIEAARLDLNLEMIIYAEVEAAAESAINDYVLATRALAPAFEAAKSAAENYKNKLASATATPEEKAAAKEAMTTAEAAYKVAQQSVVEALKEQTGTAVKLVDSKKKIAPYQLKIELLQDEKTQLEKDKGYQAGLNLEETKEAWCADLTEDASGTIEIMEIPGEDLNVLIGPQDAEHKLTNVGVLTAREVQSPEQAFFNAAILPGWQKFKPMYRRGIVLGVDTEGDTVDVRFDDDKSSAQNLDINRYKELAGVPVKYMGCNAGAFEVGDHCVIKFKNQNWSFPVVVGFVDNPKPCPGGIGIALTDLSGQPIPGHIDGDGKGAMYFLAPKTVKGTRTATGDWAARKMKNWSSGGKAVNADSTGRIYFAGVQGIGDSDYPNSLGDYGSVNEHAYAVEDGFSLPVYRHGKNIGSSRDNRAPLPFVLEWGDDGEKYAAQLVPRYPEGKYTTAMIELLIGPLKTQPGEMVGAIVATVDMPPNTIMPFWKISVHPSGRKARALSFSGGNACKIDFEITPTSLTYVTSGCRSNMVDIKDNEPAAILDAGNEDGVEWYNIINPVRTVETTLDPSFVYAYGPKGEEFDFQIDGGKHTTVSSGYFDWVRDGVDTGPSESTFTTVQETHSSSITTSNDGGSEILEFFGHGGSYTSAERVTQSKTFSTVIVDNANVIYSASSGGGEYTETTRNSSGIIPTFFDRNVGFAIGVKYVGEAITVTVPINSDNNIIPGTGTTTVTPGTIEVIAKHRKTGEFSILPKKTGGYGKLVAFSAADPLTGSVVVNLQRQSTELGATVLESWIFLVDEFGVKTIHDIIPGLPPNVRAQSNALLITV